MIWDWRCEPERSAARGVQRRTRRRGSRRAADARNCRARGSARAPTCSQTTRLSPPSAVTAPTAASTFRRRPSRSRRRTSQPSAAAIRRRSCVGVDDHRVAHGAQHRQVGLGVRVGVGGAQVDPLALGQLAHREHLALAVVERARRAARVAAFDDLRARAEAAVEGEHVRQQVGHLLRGGGHDVHRPARVLVRVGALEHLRIQPRQHPGEHARGQALQVAHGHVGDHLPHALAHLIGAIVGRAAQAEAQVLIRVAREPPARDHARLVSGAREEDPRGARHQRAVEVEERRLAVGAIRESRRRAFSPAGRSSLVLSGRRVHESWQCSDARIRASPCPPPEQIAAQPRPPPRRRSS